MALANSNTTTAPSAPATSNRQTQGAARRLIDVRPLIEIDARYARRGLHADHVGSAAWRSIRTNSLALGKWLRQGPSPHPRSALALERSHRTARRLAVGGASAASSSPRGAVETPHRGRRTPRNRKRPRGSSCRCISKPDSRAKNVSTGSGMRSGWISPTNASIRSRTAGVLKQQALCALDIELQEMDPGDATFRHE